MDSGSIILQTIDQIKQEHPELNGRVDRAAGLWYAGGVTYCGDNLWMIDSRSRSGLRHQVTFNLAWHCDCEDCQRRAPEIEFMGGRQKTCLHIVAAALSWLIDSPEAAQQPHPAPVLTLPAWLVSPVKVEG